MKTCLFTLLLISSVLTQTMAQERLMDKQGTASFFSEAPLEDIEATNAEVLGAIDLEKGTLAVAMPMKGFHFERSLMEEHFNENYVESDKFPKATFKGTIHNLSAYDFSKTGSFEVDVMGEITMHGVTQPLNTKVKFDVSSTMIKAATAFQLKVADFDIEVPKLVMKNIAEIVDVKASFNFTR